MISKEFAGVIFFFMHLCSSQQGPFIGQLLRIKLLVVIEQSSNLEIRKPVKMRNWDLEEIRI